MQAWGVHGPISDLLQHSLAENDMVMVWASMHAIWQVAN